MHSWKSPDGDASLVWEVLILGWRVETCDASSSSQAIYAYVKLLKGLLTSFQPGLVSADPRLTRPSNKDPSLLTPSSPPSFANLLQHSPNPS